MQYHCVQCNELFTLDPSEDKPRCPKCLRQHGLRPVEAVQPARSTRSLAVPIAVVSVLVLGAGGYAYYHQTHKHSPDHIPLAPLDADTVRDDVRALAATEAGPLAQLLEADAKVSAFAHGAVPGADSPDKKAQAIVAALQARKRQQAFVIWPRSDPREGPPLTASATLAAIERDGARREMYPLELSALAVAALRSVAVPALVAEVYRYPDEKTALDPSGRLGYHAVFVPAASGDGGKLYDAYGGRSAQPQAGEYVVLNDVQAVGAAFALRAMQKLDLADSKGGLADSEVAVKLVPSSASVRSVRAALLLATGGVEAGTHELDAAAQLRSDAARHNNLAVLALVSSGPDRAAKEVASALSEAPDYALARVTLASVHLMRAERDLARSELEQAERLEPNLVQLPQVWAQFYASSGDFTRAVAKGEEAVSRRPKDLQAHLVLAQVYRAASRYGDMRKQAHEIVRLAGPDDKERISSVVRALLGPTALEDTDQADPTPEQQDSPQAAPDGPGASNPTAAGDLGQTAEPGALQLHPGASKLRLGGAGSQLKLNLKP